MTENIEQNVLMICKDCMYKETVPIEQLETIRNLPPISKEYKILCLFCLNYMYKKGKKTNNNQY